MLDMVLGGPAAKVATAKNGWEALIKIGATLKPFDVVITDHRMPHMTGLERFICCLMGIRFGLIVTRMLHCANSSMRW